MFSKLRFGGKSISGLGPRVSLLLAAQALCLGQAQAADISLAQALDKTLKGNPELAAYPLYTRQWDSRRQLAKQAPGMRLSGAVENIFGSDQHQGLEGVEVSLVLSQVFERGAKANKRLALVDAEAKRQAQQFERAKLDKLAQTSRIYYALLRGQALQNWLTGKLKQEQQALNRVKQLAEAGAVTAADLARIKLQLDETQVRRIKLAEAQKLHSLRLAQMWSKKLSSKEVEYTASGDMSKLPAVPSAKRIKKALAAAPDYLVAASEARMAEAAVHLAQSKAVADVDLGLGVRHLEQSGDQTLLLEFSMPLMQKRRAAPELANATAKLKIKQQEASLQRLQLGQRLQLLGSSLKTNQEQIEQLQGKLLPQAQRLESESEKAYSNGQHSLLQWLEAQSQVATLKRQLIELRSDYLLKFLELERLSGQRFAER
ncbi:MAG: TolC family protein [Cellvibrionaceae bacterium]|nr:TolC family protein [Cellvibrionaceae bacterium]